mmetsp:Transcript_12601/g.29831  ORF Transcript_12601/g.29831 Transcript_12601/m.29831 type:complete len:207 (-) Transcript_12601:19-639(-)
MLPVLEPYHHRQRAHGVRRRDEEPERSGRDDEQGRRPRRDDVAETDDRLRLRGGDHRPSSLRLARRRSREQRRVRQQGRQARGRHGVQHRRRLGRRRRRLGHVHQERARGRLNERAKTRPSSDDGHPVHLPINPIPILIPIQFQSNLIHPVHCNTRSPHEKKNTTQTSYESIFAKPPPFLRTMPTRTGILPLCSTRAGANSATRLF